MASHSHLMQSLYPSHNKWIFFIDLTLYIYIYIFIVYCIGIDIMEVGEMGFGPTAELEYFFFFFGRPKFGTIIVVTN